MIKLGTPKENKLSSMKDMFTVGVESKKMNRLENVKQTQEEYLKKIENEGDIHYFKKQTFGPLHKRTVLIFLYIIELLIYFIRIIKEFSHPKVNSILIL